VNLSFTFGHLNIAGWILFGITFIEALGAPLLIGEKREGSSHYTWFHWVWKLLMLVLISLALGIV